MNEFEKMAAMSPTNHERIFWEWLAHFEVGAVIDSKISLVPFDDGKSIEVRLNNYHFVIFNSNDSTDVIRAYAYATAQVANILIMQKCDITLSFLKGELAKLHNGEEKNEGKANI